MRFYFDLRDGRRITDHRGKNCTTLEQARQWARELAQEMARGKDPAAIRGDYIVVVDESGQEVYRAALMAEDTA